MPKDFDRTRRVAEQIQRELAVLIQQELTDPRVKMVTVSAVELSRDLKHGKVFITSLDDTHKHNEIVNAVQHASGFLQHELGHRLRMRTIPRLHFVYDESIERGTQLSALIDKAIHDDEQSG
jgi:ribosome-binding factor A